MWSIIYVAGMLVTAQQITIHWDDPLDIFISLVMILIWPVTLVVVVFHLITKE